MVVRTCRTIDTVPFNCCKQVILTNNIACNDIICLKVNKSEKEIKIVNVFTDCRYCYSMTDLSVCL